MTEGPAPVEQTVRLYRSEDKIQPRAVSGWFAGWRWALVATLLFILLETALAGRLTRQATPAGGATA